jgi:hypothetical protein
MNIEAMERILKQASDISRVVEEIQNKLDAVEALMADRNIRITSLAFRYRQAGMDEVADDILEAYYGKKTR